MAQKSKEEKEKIEKQYGEEVDIKEHPDLGIDINGAIKVFGDLNYHRGSRHVDFFWQHFSSFKAFEENNVLDRAVEHTNLNGDQFDMFNYFSKDLIEAVLNHLSEVKDWNMDEQMLQYYSETGQDEKHAEYKKMLDINADADVDVDVDKDKDKDKDKDIDIDIKLPKK